MEKHGIRRAAVVALVGLLAPFPARADGVARPDDHAPIGVMGDHRHAAGEVMLSYRYARMSMRGNREGTARESLRSVLRRFPVAPFSMDMEKHVFGAMWAPTDDVTLMAMVPLLRLDMDHRTRMGLRFRTRSKGPGDVRLLALVALPSTGHHRLHLKAGLSLPTGSISRKDRTPMGRVRLPYPMQLGSGSFDLLPGLVYTGFSRNGSWGAEVHGTVRLHRNRRGYRLGHRYAASLFGARRWAPFVSTSLRLEWNAWGDIHGRDRDLNARLVPTVDPSLRGGRRLDLLAGINLIGTGGPVRNHRLAVELGRPVHQRLDGPQLETDWRVVVGWQVAF